MSPPAGVEVVVGEDLEAVSRAAADAFARAANAAVARRGRFTVALPGGSTPRRLLQLLATTHRDAVPWAFCHVFFGDERCVPPWDPASNYRLADEELLTRVPIPPDHVHRIRGELDPEPAAAHYDAELRAAFAGGRDAPPTEFETFDLAVLGVGADGHTASLFPGSPALAERARWAVATEAPPGVEPRDRVTVTLPVLDGAREVHFLAAGAEKHAVVSAILEADAAAARRLPYPAAWVRGSEHTIWFVDRAARGEEEA
ncbi:MAG TPA: 6-phosphogluconolactonase [Longimicrobiales bacterium]|nr:6-phosphogluconolactonase [Longimicrobiales bacterium]